MNREVPTKPSPARAAASTPVASPGGPASLEKELQERQGPGPLIDRPVSATAVANANAADQRDKMDAFAKRSAAKRRQRQSSNSQLNVANKQHAELEQLPLLKGMQVLQNLALVKRERRSARTVVDCFIDRRYGSA